MQSDLFATLADLIRPGDRSTVLGSGSVIVVLIERPHAERRHAAAQQGPPDAGALLFFDALANGSLSPEGAGVGLPALSADLYAWYRLWCARSALRPVRQPVFARALIQGGRVVTMRKRFQDAAGHGDSMRAFSFAPEALVRCPEGREWLGERARLFHRALTTYREATTPPMTDAKRVLSDISKDSPGRFLQAFVAGEVDGFPAVRSPALLIPALSNDLYALYTLWCQRVGLRSLSQTRFVCELEYRHHASTERKRYTAGAAVKGPATVICIPGGAEKPPGATDTAWLGERIEVFQDALKAYRGVSL